MTPLRVGPDIFVFDSALPPGVCQSIVEAVKHSDKWRHAEVVHGSRANGDPQRTRELLSTRSYLRNCMISTLSQHPQLEAAIGTVRDTVKSITTWWDHNVCEVPPGWSIEEPYVVRYEVGQQFARHTDIRRIHKGHNRLFTVLFYLNESLGGDLQFPDHGLTITNKPGRAVMFPSGDTYPHASNMVVGGTKYSIPVWVHYPDHHPYYHLKRRDTHAC
ncbi:2OG-Fe(II) oxygenase [Microbulbifer sp. 2201CG32-9]|uniref:2OG-Fe(II) oxygenase n=1 Tax=Microbulbifer sp. 2201CG32-9 TaxID=3232309 RepID=UPI00345BDF83